MKIVDIRNHERLSYHRGFEIEYEDRLGAIKTWEIVSRGSLDRLASEINTSAVFSDGAVIVAMDEKMEKICLVKQFRVPAGRFIYEFPAGLKDEGEEIERTAIREFKEETGMDLKIHRVDPPRYTSVGLTNERINVVYGIYSGEPSTKFLESTEEIEVELVSKKRALQILKDEEPCLRTAMLLETFIRAENSFF